MKVFAAPDDLGVPSLLVNGEVDQQQYEEAEATYLKQLQERLRTLGFPGKHTGREFHIPWADGAARYMVAETATGAMHLIHLPLGDAWDVPDYMTRGLRKGDVIRRIRADDKIASMRDERTLNVRKDRPA
jgi:hypothetical protein